MIPRRFSIIVLLIVFPSISEAKTNSKIARLEQLVDTSSFEDGRKLANILEEETKSMSKSEHIKLLHLKSRIESAFNLIGNAKKSVSKIYSIDSDYRLDPVKDLPEVYDYYESLRVAPAQIDNDQ